MKEIIRTKHVLKLTDENVVVCILKKNKKTSYCLFFLTGSCIEGERTDEKMDSLLSSFRKYSSNRCFGNSRRIISLRKSTEGCSRGGKLVKREQMGCKIL